MVAGTAPVRLLADELGIELDNSHEATVSGYILERLGRLPETGEQVDFEGVTLAVTAVKHAQVQQLRTVPQDEVPAT